MLSAGLAIAYGLTDRLTGYAVIGGNTNQYLTKGIPNLGFGLYGTLIQTDHFSMDLSAQAGIGRTGFTHSVARSRLALKDEFVFVPSIELNFDLAKDMRLAGFYVTVQEILTGLEVTQDGQLLGYFTPGTYLRFGMYWAMVPGKYELHIQFDMTFHHFDTSIVTDFKIHPIDIGGIALGLNFMLTKTLEIQTEVYFNIPQENDVFTAGFRLGLGK